MSYESLAWPQEPASTDLVDSGETYALGIRFSVLVSKLCYGVRWRVPDSVTTPPNGGHLAALWTVIGETRIGAKAFTPATGGYQDILFDTPVMLTAGTLYVVSVYTQHYVYRASGGVWPSSPSGNVVTDQGRLAGTTDPNTYPASNQIAWYYVSPLVEVDDPSTPVTSTLTGKWKVFQQVLSSLTAKWNVAGAPVVPPAVSSGYLTAQRAMTAAFIADDPTTAALIPSVKTRTPSGGFQMIDGAPRSAQTFKLSLLAYDQRPTVTLAGVERLADYHLIGPHDMQIAVADWWVDDKGTKFEVIGFTEGWDYMTKAFVSRVIPREAKL